MIEDERRLQELCTAAADGDLRAVKAALAAGGDSPNQYNYDGRGPLLLAAAEGHINVVRMLIESKADVGHRDRWGNNARDTAAARGHLIISDLLGRAMEA
eukprot:TRINITY_DN8855_c1_g2_i1.p2 TRINITY_DN8855_c1_g2~~TRINITY_DN8855_c1_g2_i1.p2  ORF type:complete len:100 (-),score=52.42 TRINITY_DN8855_c1_g2_i1:153-452(-)